MATGGTAVTFNDLSYDELNFRIETLRKNAEQLSEDLRAGLVIDVKPAMDALDDLNNKINQAEKAKAKLDREYSQPVATSYQDVTSQIESLQNKAATLREILREGISFDFNRDIVELKNVETQIKNLENVKSTLSKSSFVPADPQNYQEVLAYIDVYKEKIKELQTYLKSGESSIPYSSFTVSTAPPYSSGSPARSSSASRRQASASFTMKFRRSFGYPGSSGS